MNKGKFKFRDLLILLAACFLISSNRQVDNLPDWSYQYNPNIAQQTYEGVLPLGTITFYRKDLSQTTVFQKSYQICHRRDLGKIKTYCLNAQVLSSCVPPNVGGDYYFTRKYVFFNTDVCVSCVGRANAKQNYCQPLSETLQNNCSKCKDLPLADFLEKLGIRKRDNM